MFQKILIANRGEIAVRVIQTCRDMGIKTVAVYSHVDEKALHVLEADQAVCLGGADPAQSYLNMDKILEAAKETGAQAIHPGYGFLSENANFVERCTREKIVFIGPSAQSIRDMGDKITSRRIMEKAGVPVTPGLDGEDLSLDQVKKAAQDMGYPIMIKATAGGGGKGIRVVEDPRELDQAFEAASREAKNAFGNGRVYLEKFFTQARHIEFQILADARGKTIHLNERECSIQRRHQKIIEETPSPALTPELREKMGQAAVSAAQAAEYLNAGTVEFLLDPQNNFYFLEMNTRLQVEHPITEETCGVDLVREQIHIAAGLPLEIPKENQIPRGHAIECRIYAEDPEKAFFPSPGTIVHMEEPTGPGIRNDCGVYSGSLVPVEYDPILSKLVVRAATRDAAIDRMIKALKDYVVLGVRTPMDFLVDVLDSSPFKSGDITTDFIPAHFGDWAPRQGHTDRAALAFLADEIEPAAAPVETINVQPSPFTTLGNWRL